MRKKSNYFLFADDSLRMQNQVSARAAAKRALRKEKKSKIP
jgi:hypothetical protein